MIVLFAGAVQNGVGSPDGAGHFAGPVRPDVEAARHDRMGMIVI